jgi:soluble lytic murein transglycosylase-like protein
VLTALFAAAAAGSWSRREVAPPPPLVVAPVPVPLAAAPLPEARRRDRGGALEVAGVSEVWEAPDSRRPVTRPSDLHVVGIAGSPAAEVDRWVARLAIDQRGATRAALERMAAYEPLILHALREHGLPADLIHLALIESHFVATATSHAGAVGIWQLMPATARAHGLEVSEWVDERRDPVRSTRAAIRHLAWLHRRFGSWHLAVAAYNAGDARVGGILRDAAGRTAGDDILYWRARPLLPTETRAYVPKLLAASRIARAPDLYGFTPLQPSPPLRFRELSVPGGVPLATVAEAVGAAPETVFALNPHLVRRATPPGRRWPVRVPAELEPAPPDPGRLARFRSS